MNLNPLSWPIAARIMAVAVLAAGAGSGAALIVNSGHGQTAQSSVTPAARVTRSRTSPAASITPTPLTASSPDTSGDCFFGANGADVQVAVADPASSCSSWIQALAGDGLVWYPISRMSVPGSQGSADSDTLAETCDLTDGTQELFVEDGGSSIYGSGICNSEEQNGWTPEETPGPLASEAQQAQQQQEQEQESASAAAAQASADTAAEQQAQNDLNTLQGWSLTSDLSKLASDLGQTSADLAAEKTAAAAGPNADGGDCYNLDENVDYDAQENVEYDAQEDFGYDLQQNLTPDLASGRQDISGLQSDLSNLQSLDVSVPSGAQSAITAAQGQIASAISTANADIRQENGYVSQAYEVASSIATGNCKGDGPGSTPTPIPDIS